MLETSSIKTRVIPCFGLFETMATDLMPIAKTAALKALELDPSLAEAHVSLAGIEALYERDWSAAEGNYRLALQLNPNSADAHFMYAEYLISLKRNRE